MGSRCIGCGADVFGRRVKWCSRRCLRSHYEREDRERRSSPRAKTILGSKAAARLRGVLDLMEVQETARILDQYERPRRRADCVDGPRPCPWVGCRHHLGLIVSPSGAIKVTRPDQDPWEAGCALDVADGGARTFDAIGELINLSKEQVRNIETEGLQRLRLRKDMDQ